jgi:hypothetical protein
MGMLDENDPVESLMLATTRLCQLFISMQSAPNPPDQATLESWIAACQEADFELSQWTLHLPDHWLPLVVYSAKGEPLLTYHRISNAVIWGCYRTVRVILQQQLLNLNHTLISINQKNQQSGDPAPVEGKFDEKNVRSVIREMITDMCRSMPFWLSDVDTLGRPKKPSDNWRPVRAAQAYGLLWPLWCMISCGMPTPAQMQQMSTVLLRVGSSLGIKLALILAREAERIRGESGLSEIPVVGPKSSRNIMSDGVCTF